MRFSLKAFALIFIFSFLAGSCAPQTDASSNPSQSQTSIPVETFETGHVATETPLVIEPTQPVIAINPLTGLPVQDPSLLDLPAALVSIAHFPPEARPQAGLSYAPFVFEVYITEGATRFLAAFYGEFPAPEPYITGSCAVRASPFTQTDI